MCSEGGGNTRILHISDTHLGYAPYNSDTRKADFTDAFTQTVDIACERDVDAVVHTGDLTHDSRPEGRLPESAWRALQWLSDQGVPFYFILGNHDLTADGNPQQWATELVDDGLGVRLGSHRTTVGGVALYGIDYRPAERWGNPTLKFEQPPEGYTPILCLHQSLAPVAPGNSGIELEEILQDTSLSFPAVLVGHSHYTQAAVVDETRVFYAGSLERTTRTYDNEPTVVTELTIGDAIEQTIHELDTRGFGTYTIVPDEHQRLNSICGDAVEGEVVTLFYPEGRADGSRIESVAEASGAVDATAHATAIRLQQPPGLYESTPEDLSTVSITEGADSDDTTDSPHEADLTGNTTTTPDDAENHPTMTSTNVDSAASEHTDDPTILHVGALYIGAANLSIDRRTDFQRSLSQVVDHAIEQEVTAVVQSGTFFGTGSPPKYTIEQCREKLERLESAGIPFLHAGSERDRRMDEFDTLVGEGLITRVGSNPVLIGQTAFYGLSPGDGTTYSMNVGSLETPPAASEYVIVSGTVSVSPPIPSGDATFDAAGLRDKLPFSVDALLLGGAKTRSIDRGQPDILYPGSTERMLYQSTFDESPDYPCSVSTYRLCDGTYEMLELEYRDVHTYEFDVAPRTKLQTITERIDADLTDATVMIRLNGQCTDIDFNSSELESWLEEDAAVVKVYDKRTVVESEGETETTVSDTEGVDEGDNEQQISDKPSASGDGQAASAGSTKATQKGKQGDSTGPATGQEDVASETAAPFGSIDDSNETTEQSSPNAIDSASKSENLKDEFYPNAGSDIDPDAHLSGEQLLDAGFAEVRQTTDETCGYVFHASDFASETNQRRGVAHRDLDNGDWHCPHPATTGDRCPFHAPLSETDVDLQKHLLKNISSEEPGCTRFIGATFPALSLTYEEINAGADFLLDFTHAHFAGDIRLNDVSISPEVRFDGISVDGKLSLTNTGFQQKVRLRGALIKDGIAAQWSSFSDLVAFKDAIFEDELFFQNCDFQSVSFSNGTFGDGINLLKSDFDGEVYFYNVDIAGQLDCNRVSFGSELLFEDAFLQGGADFEEASFADTLKFEDGFAGRAFALNDTLANNRIQLESLVTTRLDCTNLRANGRVEILGGEIGEFDTNSAVFADDLRIRGTNAYSLDFRRMKIQRNCQLINPRIEQELDATEATVGGTVQLMQLQGGGSLSFVDARIEGGLNVLGAIPPVSAQGIRVDGNVIFRTETEDAGPVDASGGFFHDRVELTGSGEWTAVEVPNGTFDGLVNVDADVAGDLKASDAVFRDATIISGDIGGSINLDRARFTERLGVRQNSIGEHFSLVGARLERGIAIDNATLHTINASSVACTGSIEVIKSQITGQFTFADATATGTVEISGGEFGGFDASETVFEDTVQFQTDINGPLQLARTRFDGTTRFDGIEINGPVSLEEIRCIRLGFVSVTFGAEIDSSRATFERRARFVDSTIEGVATFTESDFDGGVIFEETEFMSTGIFSDCHITDKADFTDTRFATKPTFENATIEEVDFDGLGGTDNEVLSVDCTEATIRDGQINQPHSGTNYDFTDAQLGSITLDLDGGTLDCYRFYRTSFDGFQFSDHVELAAADWCIHEYRGEGTTSPEGLETTYRRAKNGAGQVGDSDAEGHFFVKEMRHRKTTHKQAGKKRSAIINELYRRTSGYGERPGRVITSAGYITLGFAVLFPLTKILALLSSGQSLDTATSQLLSGQIFEAPYSGIFGWLLLSGESFTTLVHGGTNVVHPWVRGLGAFEGFIGAFFIALFLFTLTKSIDR